MRSIRLPSPLRGAAIAAFALVLQGCSSSGFGPTADPQPTAPPAETPARYTAEEIVGRWGYASYHKDADRARTEVAARGQCRQPYIIAKGPNGGVIMHLPDQRQPTELRLKGAPGGRSFIGPEGEAAGGAQDREIIAFDGRVMVTRYVDSDAGNRFGNMVYVRCSPRA